MSFKSRVQNKLGKAVDSVVDTIQDSPSLHVNFFHKEVSDLWRRDDRQLKKLENRGERDALIYASRLAEQQRQKQASESSRLSRRMQLGGGQASGGRGNAMLLSLLGLMAPPNTTNSTLGGGA